MKSEILIIDMLPDHWPEVSEIYREGIETGMATFEKEMPSWENWNNNHIKACRMVAKIDDIIVGWVALSHVSSRCVYGGVAEVSVYISEKTRGNQIGYKLMKKVIEESEINGYWTLQSGVFPENIASIKLHEKAGFRIIGFREKIGKLDGVWKNNILMERRSKKAGI
jgi:phosphinothricin acetyltransferase